MGWYWKRECAAVWFDPEFFVHKATQEFYVEQHGWGML